MRPPSGLCLPVRYHRCRDGDTVEVSLPQSSYIHPVRLIDCWCPEKNEEGYLEAKEFAENILENCEDLYLFIPLDSPGLNLQKALLSFDRVLGELWVSPTQTLNQMLVEAGYAQVRKGSLKR